MDLAILNRGQMTKTTPKLAAPFQGFAAQRREGFGPLYMIWRAAGPIHAKWNRVSNLEHSGPEAESLPLDHRGLSNFEATRKLFSKGHHNFEPRSADKDDT
ncbi:hypothetical protein AVEN_253507-1 [Araneus ventricosus]|uniref:Uncharacterized protein n=1 Tax=Araneus ventricosus TaxID=182803 RepID=A0A4Y2BSX5_ARAVE|nr:hypothetical protein AVEN_253507-1 [Araneus ventricosus]